MTVFLITLGILAPAVALVALLLEPHLWQRYDAWANAYYDWRDEAQRETLIQLGVDELLREAKP